MMRDTDVFNNVCVLDADLTARPQQWWSVLTSILPADILQVEVWVIWHVFLYPGPTVDLLVCRGDDEEAGEETKYACSAKWSSTFHDVCSGIAKMSQTCSC